MGFLLRMFGKRVSIPNPDKLGFEPISSFHTKIVGVTKSNPDGSKRQDILRDFRDGDLVILQREPDNEFDPNAIASYDQFMRQVGHLPSDTAEGLIRDMDDGTAALVRNIEVTGGYGEKQNLGCNLEIGLYDPKDEVP